MFHCQAQKPNETPQKPRTGYSAPQIHDLAFGPSLVGTDPIGANLLKDYWADIVHLAEALLCKGRLEEKEALAVLGSTTTMNGQAHVLRQN
jgi:hypothetical protein